MVNKKKTILIIDDEAIYRETLSRALIKCGFSCKAVDNSSDGLNLIKSNNLDLVLLDIMMEPFDGWETLDSIRNLKTKDKMPVMMASGKLLDPEEILRYGERLFGYIKKPVEDDEICDTINEYFSWNEEQQKKANVLMIHGASAHEAQMMIDLSREIRVLPILLEYMSPHCLPEEGMSEEECMASKLSEIEHKIVEKRKILSSLLEKYAVIS